MSMIASPEAGMLAWSKPPEHHHLDRDDLDPMSLHAPDRGPACSRRGALLSFKFHR
jgi:hypothetical protein